MLNRVTGPRKAVAIVLVVVGTLAFVAFGFLMGMEGWLSAPVDSLPPLYWLALAVVYLLYWGMVIVSVPTWFAPRVPLRRAGGAFWAWFVIFAVVGLWELGTNPATGGSMAWIGVLPTCVLAAWWQWPRAVPAPPDVPQG